MAYSTFSYEMANILIDRLQMTEPAKEMVLDFAKAYIHYDVIHDDVETKLSNAVQSCIYGNMQEAQEWFDSACRIYGSHHGCTDELLGREPKKDTIYDGQKITIEGIEFTFRLIDDGFNEYEVTKINKRGKEVVVCKVNGTDDMGYIEYKIRDEECL